MPERYWLDVDGQTIFKSESGVHYRWSDSTIVDISPSVELVPGLRYFIVMVDYTTGDSLGRSPEIFHEIVDAYPTFEKADEIATKIVNNIHSRELTLEFANGDTKDRHYWPWMGYFERVEEVTVIEAALSITLPPIYKKYMGY